MEDPRIHVEFVVSNGGDLRCLAARATTVIPRVGETVQLMGDAFDSGCEEFHVVGINYIVDEDNSEIEAQVYLGEVGAEYRLLCTCKPVSRKQDPKDEDKCINCGDRWPWRRIAKENSEAERKSHGKKKS